MVKTSSRNSSPPFNLTNSVKLSEIENLEDTLFLASKKSTVNWWQKKSIRWKATVLAITIATIPTAILGLIAYSTANNSLTKQITEEKKTLITNLQSKIDFFLADRLKDIKMMANLDLLANPQLRNRATQVEKTAALKEIKAIYGIYDSIAVFDLQGNVIAQTEEKPLGNHLDRDYIQSALKSNDAVLSQPRISTSSGIYSLYVAAPIKDRLTGQTIAVIRARMPLTVLTEILQNFTQKGDNYYLLDQTGTIFLSSAADYVIPTLSNSQNATSESSQGKQGVKIEEVFGGIEALVSSNLSETNDSVANLQSNGKKKFVAYVPAQPKTIFADLKWRGLIATEQSQLFAPQKRLGQIYALGTTAIAILVGIIAFYLAQLATRPILSAATTVNEIGEGNLQARTNIKGEDEISQLGVNINLMASQLEKFVQEQNLVTEQIDIVKQTILALSTASEQEELWDIALNQIKLGLSIDGAVYYNLEQQQVVTNPVSEITANEIKVICTSPSVTKFLQQSSSELLIIDNLAQTQDTLKSLSSSKFAIAKIKHQGQTIGLLVIYQQAINQPWQKSELDFLQQIASQVNFSLDRLDFLQQQQEAQKREKQAKEKLQQRALELLQQVDPLSRGDLTIRAKVTEDEIGTIADSYNATIYSLQKLVNQVKNVAEEVEQTAGTNQSIIQQLATEAIQQAQSIEQTMQQIQQMTQSIGEVSQSALTAQQIVEQANQTIMSGDTAMNQAVIQINNLQTTVGETEQKAKLLGESSQEIAQVVNSISRFAAQTHLLALKASIEAARAGEQGKGFATIADEVRSLATQSATATTDIENIVAKIQLETNALVTAMAQGTEQVTLGTNLVKQTRQSLNQVTIASQEISQLVATIAQSAQGQSVISQKVSENIASVAVSAQANSQSATQVSLKIEQLLTLANKLQKDIGQFKT